jgi:hypothetical protein
MAEFIIRSSNSNGLLISMSPWLTKDPSQKKTQEKEKENLETFQIRINQMMANINRKLKWNKILK